jgi:hypothetical protein
MTKVIQRTPNLGITIKMKKQAEPLPTPKPEPKPTPEPESPMTLRWLCPKDMGGYGSGMGTWFDDKGAEIQGPDWVYFDPDGRVPTAGQWEAWPEDWLTAHRKNYTAVSVEMGNAGAIEIMAIAENATGTLEWSAAHDELSLPESTTMPDASVWPSSSTPFFILPSGHACMVRFRESARGTLRLRVKNETMQPPLEITLDIIADALYY